MLYNKPLIFRNKVTGHDVHCWDGSEAATLLHNNPGMYESAPGMDSFNTLQSLYGVDAMGNRMDGGGFIGNASGQAGYTPGQRDAGGGNVFDSFFDFFNS